MAYFPPSGSVVAFQSDGTKLGVSVVGLTPVNVSNFPTNQNVSGSVVAVVSGIPNVNVAGSVVSFINGTVPVNAAGSVVAFISGTVPVNAAGSVVAFQGTSPWVVNFQNSSIIATPTGTQNVSGSVVAFVSGTVAVNTAGSVVSFQGTLPWVIQSIVGTYSEDLASTSADKGLLVFGTRNDTVASLVGSDLDYGSWAQDSAGRHLIKPFVSEDGTIISYVGSVVSGSVTLIQSSATGKRNYITDFWVTNTGSVSALITFQGGDTSLVGYTIAPAGGGSNSPGISVPLKSNLSQDLAFKATGTSSVVYMTVKGYQAP